MASVQDAVAAVQDKEAPGLQLVDPAASQPSGGREEALAPAGNSAEPHPPPPKPDPPLTHVASPFWASSSPLSFGIQVAYSMQAPVPANGSHIDLLYVQPQVAVVLRNFERSPFERIQMLNEGMLGGAVNPGGHVLGYALLFRLEGRTRGNTKLILDWGAGIVETTLDHHAYELAGPLQFTPQAGIGFEHFFSPQRAFVLEYRFLHMSNAGLLEPNHGVHSSVLTVGFRWLLRRPRD